MELRSISRGGGKSVTCDHPFNRIRKHFECALKRAYFSAELNILYTTKGIGSQQTIDNYVSDLNLVHITDQFTCRCSDIAISRTDRCLGRRIREHVPKWLGKQITQLPSHNRKRAWKSWPRKSRNSLRSSIIKMTPGQAFQVILRNGDSWLLVFCEVLSINRLRPPLNERKLLTHNVCLFQC